MRIALLLITMLASTFAAADRVYWSEEDTDRVMRGNLDGTRVEELVSEPVSENPGVLGLDPLNGKLYWGSFAFIPPFTPKINRADLDGGNAEQMVIVPSKARPAGIALDLVEGKVYYTDPSDCSFCGAIRRMNLDGSGVEIVEDFVDFPVALAIDPGGSIWWSNFDSIIRADLDGGNQQTIVSGTRALGIAVDTAGAKVYWTDDTSTKIRRANYDGSAAEDLVTSGLSSPVGIALDVAAGKMIWADRTLGWIRRADLDGSNVETVISGLTTPTHVALEIRTLPGVARELRLSRPAPGSLLLDWSADCGGGNRYAVYRGDLSLGYASIMPETGFCGVMGTTALIPEGTGGGEFFLVVPSRSGREGSYGTDSQGNPRNASTPSCLPQGRIDACGS